MMNEQMNNILFLPGAIGSASHWHPVATRMGANGTFLAWPGLGNEPAIHNVNELDDLVAMTLAHVTGRVDIVAQSMGGLIAIKVALAAPTKVRRLVLTATSAGVPVRDLGGSDWRPEYYRTYPDAALWITELEEDLSADIASIQAPTLLLWGDSDPISPLEVGHRLHRILPDAVLEIISGGDHDLARTHAPEVAELIKAHLWQS